MFKSVPFGLKNMTGHMQRLMEKLLNIHGVLPYLDDIAIASETAEEHIAKVLKVLEAITYEANLRLNIEKCKFFATEARVLGSLVTSEGIRMDPDKVKSILAWEKPMTAKGMQRFLGAANFHRDFSHNFATMAAPLESMRNAKGILEWTSEQEKAFKNIKE